MTTQGRVPFGKHVAPARTGPAPSPAPQVYPRHLPAAGKHFAPTLRTRLPRGSAGSLSSGRQALPVRPGIAGIEQTSAFVWHFLLFPSFNKVISHLR